MTVALPVGATAFGRVTTHESDYAAPMASVESMGNSTTVDWRVIDDLRPLAAATLRPAATVSPDDIDTFQREGVVYLPAAFTEWVEPLRAGLERNLQHPDCTRFRVRALAPTSRGGSSTATATGS